ncbi:DDE-type integrase/transposase/recombinase [Brucella gallinifaecis]|uniref:DDE-type integrase/transposase/recombinase n=1 Tax=Brucella gallinifaecis TaxID=215590 RepID=A0A502BNV4_9HYPH|nr:DDE-type integrase/transposase/recombinase [Brucella gallinifaecis]
MKVRRRWTSIYRTVDRAGQTLEFMLSEHRNPGAAWRFLKKGSLIKAFRAI